MESLIARATLQIGQKATYFPLRKNVLMASEVASTSTLSMIILWGTRWRRAFLSFSLHDSKRSACGPSSIFDSSCTVPSTICTESSDACRTKTWFVGWICCSIWISFLLFLSAQNSTIDLRLSVTKNGSRYSWMEYPDRSKSLLATVRTSSVTFALPFRMRITWNEILWFYLCINYQN